MAFRILVLGASYGSLFGTKCAMAGHDVTLVCRSETAELINRAGTVVRIKLKGEAAPRAIRSADLIGNVRAATPDAVDPSGFDLAVLAMQEPQYGHHTIRPLMAKLAEARVPCLSLMNMPPAPYLKRLDAIDAGALDDAFSNIKVWDRFDPRAVTLCSPDPQAVRPADEPANVLQVNLATNFKAAEFGLPEYNAILHALADDIESVRLAGMDVPVKLRVSPSLFVPLAKWPMLMTGNYRCVMPGHPIAIRDAVWGDPALSRDIYSCAEAIVLRMGAEPDDLVAFDKYAAAAEQLVRPSSVARALAEGAPAVERVDRLIQAVGRQIGISHPAIDRIVALVDASLAGNRARAA
jgi:hypothetical protein